MAHHQSPPSSSSALAWLQGIYEHGKSTHNESLFSYFRGQTKQEDLTLPVVTLLTASCKAVFGTSTHITAPPAPASSSSDARLDPSACASYLYYMVAESLLQRLFPRDMVQRDAAGSEQQQQRFKGMLKVHNPPACRELVSCQEFHMPLIECALQLVHAVTTAPQAESQELPHVSHVLQRQDRAALLWQAASTFKACFGPSSPFPMPQPLVQYLTHMQEQLLQGPALQSGSVLFEVLTAGGGCQFLPGDKTLAHNVVAAYGEQAVQQAQQVAWALQQDPAAGSASFAADFHQQCAWLMDQVVLRHLDVCFGVRMEVVVACVVYLTAKVSQAAVSFSAIVQALTTTLGCSPEVCCDVEVSAQPPQLGDVRAYYNTRFLAAVQTGVRAYLQQYQDWLGDQPAALPTTSTQLLATSQPCMAEAAVIAAPSQHNAQQPGGIIGTSMLARPAHHPQAQPLQEPSTARVPFSAINLQQPQQPLSLQRKRRSAALGRSGQAAKLPPVVHEGKENATDEECAGAGVELLRADAGRPRIPLTQPSVPVHVVRHLR